MDKQKALKTIDISLKALEDLERALKNNDQRKVQAELWKARRELLKLNMMIVKEKDS